MRSTNRTGRKKTSEQKTPGIVKAFYIAAAVLMAVCIYMIVVNSMYIVNYASSYGLELADMKLDAIQYIVTGSISYFVYGALLFAAGRIISMICRAQASGSCIALEDEELYTSEDLQDTIGALSTETAADADGADSSVESVESGSADADSSEGSGKDDVKDADGDPSDDQEDA